MSWNESRVVNKDKMHASRYVMTFLGLNLKFEICCVWLQGGFRWMLNSESMGIHANLISKAGDISKEEVKHKALFLIRKILTDRIEEVDLQLKDFEGARLGLD